MSVVIKATLSVAFSLQQLESTDTTGTGSFCLMPMSLADSSFVLWLGTSPVLGTGSPSGGYGEGSDSGLQVEAGASGGNGTKEVTGCDKGTLLP